MIDELKRILQNSGIALIRLDLRNFQGGHEENHKSRYPVSKHLRNTNLDLYLLTKLFGSTLQTRVS
jgi:hypothetical protein